MSMISFNSRLRRASAGLLLATLGTTLLAQSATPVPATQIYTCIDAKGRKLNSDRPIMECRDREQTILNPSGTVKARLGPALTASERNQSEARMRAEEKERAMRDREKSLNRSLWIRYPNPAAHQKDRDEAVAQLMLVKQAAAARVTVLQAERAKLADEVAFYAKNPGKAPAKLQRQVNESSQILAAQKRFLAEQDNELKRVNARFDEELKRLEPLWRVN
ncbi:MAG: DUF4124 domain-containing protein, partial [Betaproteobacteria bacterium HGW-Betaproteobacteria-18]